MRLKQVPLRIELATVYPRGGWDNDYFISLFGRFSLKILDYFEKDISERLIKELRDTSKHWTRRPTFYKKIWKLEGVYSGIHMGWVLTIRVKGKGTRNWIRVSQGVKERIIRPRRVRSKNIYYKRRKGILKFRVGYRPHTLPGGRWGRENLRYGKWVKTTKVNWPGIEARFFEREIMNKYEPVINREVARIVRRFFG